MIEATWYHGSHPLPIGGLPIVLYVLVAALAAVMAVAVLTVRHRRGNLLARKRARVLRLESWTHG